MKWEWESDELHFNSLAQPVADSAVELLTEMFGPRCQGFIDDCECCRRWRLLDELIANPFTKLPGEQARQEGGYDNRRSGAARHAAKEAVAVETPPVPFEDVGDHEGRDQGGCDPPGDRMHVPGDEAE